MGIRSKDLQLMEELGNEARRIIVDTSEDGKAFSAPPIRRLLSHEEYTVDILNFASEVVGACEQMEFAINFLSGYRSWMSPPDARLTRFDYVVYHLESHLVRTGMVLDRSLLLTNAIYRLGLPDRECRLTTVAQNANVGEKVCLALEDLSRVTQDTRAQRNAVVHRHRYADEEIDELEIYHVLQKSGDDASADYYYSMKRNMDNAVSSKQQELNRFNDDVFQAVDVLFDALLAPYLRVKNSLRSAA